MIRLKNVTKSFHSKTVLSDVNFELQNGQVHILIGSSGSGKTTLLKLLAGLIRPDSGDLSVLNYSNIQLSQREYLNHLGYVIQDGGLFPHLTAKNNVLLGAIGVSTKDKELAVRLNDLTEMVGLDKELLEKYPCQLSGGQKQRVGIMRALLKDPKILLMDEPLGALDPLIRSELQQQLKAIFKQLSKTVIFVTHDLAEAAYFGNTVTLLHEGKIIQHGQFSDLVKSPKSSFVSEFVLAQSPEALIKELS